MRLGLAVLLFGPSLLAYELHMNGGGPACTSPTGIQFDADASYVPGGAGFLGGMCTPPAWDPIGGTDIPELYATSRVGFDGFAADVANGSYVLTLHLCELEKFGPGLRLMRVVIEDAVVDTIDVFTLAHHAYALGLRYAVTVSDGQCTVRLESLYRPNMLSGIELVSWDPDGVAPAPPQEFETRDGYGFAMLTWSQVIEGDAVGVLVYREHEGQETCITPEPVTVPLFLDYSIAGASRYSVRAVDVFGNMGSPTAGRDAHPLTLTDSPLPVYEIQADPQDLAILQDDPWTNTYIPARFEAGGNIYDPVGLRYRGNVARRFTKKSYKINLGDGQFQDREIVNLNADYADWSMLHSALSFGLFDSMDVRPPLATHVHVELNGRFAGVYLSVEQPDRRFLIRTGRDSTASIYKCNGNLGLLPGVTDYQRCYDKKTNEDLGFDDLITFIEAVNLSGTEGLPSLLLDRLDVASYLRYYAVIVATADNDFTERNYYLIHDIARDRWEVVPWDLDLTFGLGFPFEFGEVCNPPIDVGTLHSPQCIGGANMLLDRVLSIPAFRSYYASQLQYLLHNEFTPSAVAGQVQTAHDRIAPDALLDVLKLGREDNTLFAGSPGDLNGFVAMRHAFLVSELESFAPAETLYVVINEVQPDNRGTYSDEVGEFDPWLELWNMSPASTGLGGWQLCLGNERWTLPATTITPGTHRVVWLDGEPGEGALHCHWRLPAQGGAISLHRPGGGPVDDVSVPPCAPDLSYSRAHDGGHSWRIGCPTPGTANPPRAGTPPSLGGIAHVPIVPLPGQPVTVVARVTDPEQDLAAVQLMIDRGAGFWRAAMHDDGTHGDGAAGDGEYGGTIPGFELGAVIHYVVRAEDQTGGVTVTPPVTAPCRYVVGLQLPPLRLNEFMASNDATIADEWGEYDDWLELYNPGPDTLWALRISLTDDFGTPSRWLLPSETVLAPGAFLLIWTDGETEQGPFHAPFKIDAEGEQLGLFLHTGESFVALDTVTFGYQATDVSHGRFPDGSGPWGPATRPTPGTTNAPLTSGMPPPNTRPAIPTLEAVWPHPAGCSASLRLVVPQAGKAVVDVHDMAGRLVASVWSGHLPAGRHTITVPLDLASGLYVVRLAAPSGRTFRRLVIAR